MAKPNLRAVDPDEKAPRKRPLSIVESVKAGDQLAEMKATHLRIAETVQDPTTSPRDLASLSRRQMELSKEIAALERQLAEEVADGAVSGDEEFDQAAI